MIVHPHPDPVAFEVFGLPIRWYALTYLAGFAIAWWISRRTLRRPGFAVMRAVDLETMIFAAALGVIIGGRLGYTLFYNPLHYFQNPLEILRVWAGGMSFHGGLIGVIVALWIFAGGAARDAELPRGGLFLRIMDLAAVMAPPGLGFGRLGNFVNAELPGRVVANAELPWAVSFGVPDYLPRHPSQLYQFFIEGVLLTALMLWLSRRPRAAGFLAGVFLAAYGCGRFVSEFFREPDAHLGFLLFDLSMGQLLSLPMMALGGLLALAPWRRRAGRPFLAKLRASLFAAPVGNWDAIPEAESPAADADVDAEKQEKRAGGFSLGRLFRGDDEDDDDDEITLTRRDKRRMRKKKRHRSYGDRR